MELDEVGEIECWGDREGCGEGIRWGDGIWWGDEWWGDEIIGYCGENWCENGIFWEIWNDCGDLMGEVWDGMFRNELGLWGFCWGDEV